jgi:hypothetical protein
MANTAGEMREDQGSSKRALGDMAMGFFRGKVLCAAVRLGIADALANGPMTVDELAAATSTNQSALRRFMRALASIGVHVGRVGSGRFVESGRPASTFEAHLLVPTRVCRPECAVFLVGRATIPTGGRDVPCLVCPRPTHVPV